MLKQLLLKSASRPIDNRIAFCHYGVIDRFTEWLFDKVEDNVNESLRGDFKYVENFVALNHA
jgi:hypothetical protein